MSQENKPVETKVEVAGTSTETVVTPTATEVDYEAILKHKDDELLKVREEKENYRKGLLKAKGKLLDEDETDTQSSETTEQMMRRVAREELLSTKEAQLQAEKDDALKSVLKRNKELEIALKNRGQITSPSGQGSNQDKPEGKIDNYFSNEQISALRAKGYDDKKIEVLKSNM